jgi:hypothetical protein
MDPVNDGTEQEPTEDTIMGKKFKRSDAANFMVDGGIVFDEEDCERYVPVTIARLPASIDPNRGPWQGKLYEAMGDERDAYFTELSGRMKRDDKGRALGLSSSKGIHGLLLRFTLVDDATGKPMPMATIGKLPAHITQVLFDHCRVMSAIGEEKEADEGEK